MSRFTAVKYIVYGLLTVNIGLFLQEELLALEHTFAGQLQLGDVIQAFSASIDTAAWVILLLLFELETCVIPDHLIKGRVKLALHGVRYLCGILILYSFKGYVEELLTLYQVAPLSVADACALVAADWSILVDLDEYLALSAQNCSAVAGPLWQISEFQILADSQTLSAAQWLAWTDVINAGAWILVVVVLEIDVRLELGGGMERSAVRLNTVVKLILYAVLFVCAVYWGVAGDFLDFWDAFLWLFAFIFIELNVFDWQAEQKAASPTEA